MSAKLYIRRGGGASVDTDYTSFTGLQKGAPFLDHNEPIIQMGMRCENGEASQGYVKILDPEAILPTSTFRVPPHALVTLTEDASGDELWLARGRVAPLETGRGDQKADNHIEHDVTVNDANMDLRGLPFTEPWARPGESGRARVVALQAYILNGSSSTAPDFDGDTAKRVTTEITVAGGDHLCPNSDLTDMPHKVYPPGTMPQEVIADCAETEGKIYSVVIHHLGGSSHLCLLYIKNDDHSTFSSAVKISQLVSEWDPDDPTAPVFEPIYDMGKGTAWDHDAVATALVSRWSGTNDEPAYVFASRPGLITDYEYWGEVYDDADSETEAQAQLRAETIVDSRSPSVLTNRCSILMSASQTHLIGAGMSIELKAPPLATGAVPSAYQTRRIAELKWEPSPDGRWFAHMQLGRGLRTRPPRSGAGQPKSTTPKPAEPPTGGSDSELFCGTWNGPVQEEFDTPDGPADWPAIERVNGGPGQDGANGYVVLGVEGGSTPDLAATAGETYTATAYFRNPFWGLTVGLNFYSAADVLLTSTLMYTAPVQTEWTFGSATAVAPVGTAYLDIVWAGSGHLDTMCINEVGAAPAGGDPPADVGDEPDTGTATCYARCDHVHAHGEAHVGDNQHSAPSITVIDTGGNFDPDVDTVEEALAALADQIASIGGGGGDLGEFTTDTPVEIVDEANYASEPGVARMGNGDLIMVYRRGTHHVTGADGILYMRTSSDNGDTWSAEDTIWDPSPGDGIQDQEVAVLSDGTVIVSGFLSDGAVGTDLFTIRSFDNGATWDTAVTFTIFAAENACSAKVIELGSPSNLGLPIYGRTAGGAQFDARFIFSADGGDTWGGSVVIEDGAGGDWTEPYVQRITGGDLLCLIRVDNISDIYYSTSADDGLTWSNAVFAFDGTGRPAFMETDSKVLIAMYRAQTSFDVVYRTNITPASTFDPTDWSSPVVIDSSSDQQYASGVQLTASTIGFAYGIGNFTTTCDINWVVFTDEAAADPFPIYQLRSEKGVASGYASLGADTLVPQSQLGTGVQDGTKFLRDDGTWQEIPASGADSWIVDPGAPSYSGSGPVVVTLTSKFGIDGSGNPYYNAANVTDGEEAALVWDSITGTYSLRPYYP